MSYEWSMATLPAATFDGQIQIDQLNQVYRWDATSSVWVRCPELYLEELRSASVYAIGVSTTMSPLYRKQSLLRNNWDVAFDKAFVSVEDLADPTIVYGRIAHVDLSGLTAWLQTVVPVGGGAYQTNFRIRVLQVVDPRRKPDRVYGWNAMYGAMRGRNAYRNQKGRNQLSLSNRCGIDPKSFAHFPTSPAPEIQLVQLFCGQTPLAGETNAIWFPVGKQDLTVMPDNNGAVLVPTYTDRMCWDTVAQAWQNIANGSQWRTADGLVNNPACFAAGDGIVGMDVGELKYYMHGGGTNFITQHRTIVVVYHLVDSSDPTKHAFYIKPMGITSMAADVQVSTGEWALMAVSRYEGDGCNMRFVKVQGVEDRLPNDGWRWSVHSTLPAFSSRSGSRDWGLSTNKIPNTIHYYIRNNITGVVSPYFPGSVEIARRRYNMAMGFLERRG